ncbi:MAG: MraY family glycosyltransferase [Bacteroidota bacterium]
MNSLIGLSMTCAFGITYLLIPSIINIAERKKIFDLPGGRKTHAAPIPALGGIGIFMGFLIALLLFIEFDFQVNVKFLTVASIMLVLIGIKDDLIGISAKQKLFFQWVVVSILHQAGFNTIGIVDLTFAGMAAPSLHYVLTSGFLILLINAYNLIDGIDGLAGSLGLIVSVTFGGIFLFHGHTNLSLICFSLAGALLAFLRFNFYKARIFMGDTGSMLIGLMTGIFSLVCLKLQPPVFESPLALIPLIYSIILIPVFDLGRVFIRRILKGRSPFEADRSHIHHLFQKGGCGSVKTCLILITFNIAMIGLAFSLLQLNSWLSSVAILSLCMIGMMAGLVTWLNVKKDSTTSVSYKEPIK